MKSQFIFAFAALLVLASLITEGDCLAGNIPSRKVIYWNENILKKTDVRKELIGYAISDYQKRALLKNLSRENEICLH